MRYVNEFRDKRLIDHIISNLRGFNKRDYTFMEVCGGHTYAFHRFGLPAIIPPNFRLLSGPGCPVCVTGKSLIEKAIIYSGMNAFVITTFGDLMRVPGINSSLEKEKSKGKDIRIVYSPLDSLEIAIKEPEKIIVFIGIGFETTAPGTAIAIKEAARKGISNFFVLSAHKIMPPAMKAIITGGSELDGFICPGHVCAITGSEIFDFIPNDHQIGCVVTGFEPLDMLQALYMLAHQLEKSDPKVEIQYRRAVSSKGNLIAKKIMNEIFEYSDEWWRGFGTIPLSGLKLRKEFSSFDIEAIYPVSVIENVDDKGCICGNILRGIESPDNCRLFSKVCNPSNPVGACMVSAEGACHTYYKFKKYD